MEDEKILERIQKIMKNSFDQENITMDTVIKEDLDIDSLDFVDLVLEIEETWNVAIPDEVAQGFTTVKDVVTYIKENA